MVRSRYLEENPCSKMVGPEFVCPVVTIDELCSQATYIDSVMILLVSNLNLKNTSSMSFLLFYPSLFLVNINIVHKYDVFSPVIVFFL